MASCTLHYYLLTHFDHAVICVMSNAVSFVKLGDDAMKISVEQPAMKTSCLYVESAKIYRPITFVCIWFGDV